MRAPGLLGRYAGPAAMALSLACGGTVGHQESARTQQQDSGASAPDSFADAADQATPTAGRPDADAPEATASSAMQIGFSDAAIEAS
ncbi:MAG: hypothetical protein ACLP1X_20795 [Polyangiaceae bacterium]|jgi:hypothetical protein